MQSRTSQLKGMIDKTRQLIWGIDKMKNIWQGIVVHKITYSNYAVFHKNSR